MKIFLYPLLISVLLCCPPIRCFGEDSKPLSDITTIRLAGFNGWFTKPLSNKEIQSIIKYEDIDQIIVVKNNTSAPDQLHLCGIKDAINQNVELRPPTDDDNQNKTKAMFSAILVTKDKTYVGIDWFGEFARITTEDGAAMTIKKDNANHGLESTSAPPAAGTPETHL